MDIVQTHVDQIVGIEDETNRFQTPLFEGGPTVNGMVMNGENVAWPDSVEDANTSWDDGEQSPFQNEMPDWMRDESAPPDLVVAATSIDESQPGEEPVTDMQEVEGGGEMEAESGQESISADERLPEAKSARSATSSRQANPVKQVESIAPSSDVNVPATVSPKQDKSARSRHLLIVFRRSGDLARDKFRLREIYDIVRDPRGRDTFAIRVIINGHTAELAFPNDGCSITDRLVNDLKKHLRLEVSVE